MQDPQGTPDQRHIPLTKVGVQDVRLPLVWHEASGEFSCRTVGLFTLGASLAAEAKGTHMSRFLQELYNVGDDFSAVTLKDLLIRIQERLSADNVFVTLSCPLFYKKKAPVSGIEGWAEVNLDESWHWRQSPEQSLSRKRTVQIPVKSLCPCSKSISENGAHNQRSHIRIEVDTVNPPSVHELVHCAETSASAALYSILKREDEKFITELAYNNPRFVEDLVRETFLKVRDLGAFSFAVDAINFESIHNHNVFARAEWHLPTTK